MMTTRQLATRIDANVKKALELFCKNRGLKMNHFIEAAILNSLEEYEDISEIKKLKSETFKPFSSVLKDLKKNGKI